MDALGGQGNAGRRRYSALAGFAARSAHRLPASGRSAVRRQHC
jgi:hypothetical protein